MVRLQLDLADAVEDPLAATGDERGDVQPQLDDRARHQVLVEQPPPTNASEPASR